MKLSERFYWAVTISPSPYKKLLVDYKTHTMGYYVSTSFEHQQSYIESRLKNYSFSHKYYEHTPTCPKKRLHLHGAIWLSVNEMMQFIDLCREYFDTPKYKNQALFVKHITDEDGWIEYMQKEQLDDDMNPIINNLIITPQGDYTG